MLQRQREWFEALMYLERRYHRFAADWARVKYLSGAAVAVRGRAAPPDRFAPPDWNVRAWLDRDREAAEAEADDPGVRFKIARLVDALEAVRGPGRGGGRAQGGARPASNARRREGEEKRWRSSRASPSAAPAAGAALEDRDDATALAAIRCGGFARGAPRERRAQGAHESGGKEG